MTTSAYKTSTGVYLLALSLLYVCGSNRVIAAPQPVPPEVMYRDDYSMELPSQGLVDSLKMRAQRKEEKIEREIADLAEEQIEIQALIEAKARSLKEHQLQHRQDYSMEDPETLPVPAAYRNGPLRSGKRSDNHYMTLCHFKICNMGRKRQM